MNRLSDCIYLITFTLAFLGVAIRIDPESNIVVPFAIMTLTSLYFIFIAFERRHK